MLPKIKYKQILRLNKYTPDAEIMLLENFFVAVCVEAWFGKRGEWLHQLYLHARPDAIIFAYRCRQTLSGNKIVLYAELDGLFRTFTIITEIRAHGPDHMSNLLYRAVLLGMRVSFCLTSGNKMNWLESAGKFCANGFSHLFKPETEEK